MKKYFLYFIKVFMLLSVSFNVNGTTLYLVAPAEVNSNHPYILSPKGLNHSLLLAAYIHTTLIPNIGLNDVLFLTGSPEYMRSDVSGNTCSNPKNKSYLSNPMLCYFDTTPFATLDPTVIYYNKLIHAIDPTLTTHQPQKLFPSSANTLTDFSDLQGDIAGYAHSYNTIILSWPKKQLSALINSFPHCSVPAGFKGNPGEIVKMNLNGITCTNSPTLIEDGLTPENSFPNILNQNSEVTAGLATPKNKYVIFIRHGEKWDNSSTGGELTCLGLNRALAVAYYIQQKYGMPDVIMGASLTTEGSPPPLPQLYASRALEKIMPYAVLTRTDIKVLPLNLHGNALQNTINTLINNAHNKLIVFGWESANAARIADAIILNRWNIPTGTNQPFYWNANDYEQNIVLHYQCTSPTRCTLKNDYYINDEDYGDILPSWCGNPVNS